jgi:RNA polymerase primary sigma factor
MSMSAAVSAFTTGSVHHRRAMFGTPRLNVVTDPDVLLREYTREAGISSLEKSYLMSSMASNDFMWVEEEIKPRVEEDIAVKPRTSEAKRIKVARSRSSTMPGLSIDADRQRAYKEKMRKVERLTGRTIVETADARLKRRKSNGESMYKNSATVPDSLVQFADEIHQVERITRKEEIELGTKTQEAIKLQRLYDNLENKLNREPTDEEWCAAAGKINMESLRQSIEDGIEAKNRLVTSNLRMVQSVVNTYIRNGLTAQYNAGDLMQDGIIALIRAAEKFEPDRGWKFSTYAMYWVRASVKRSQISQSRVISVPQRLHENYKRLLKLEKDMIATMGRRPTREELGKEVGMSKLQVERCFKAMEQQCFSLDQEVTNSKKPINTDGRSTLIELVGANIVDSDAERQSSNVLREDLIEAMKKHLTDEEVEVILLRYGLKGDSAYNSGGQLTIAELSQSMGVKPDKVRRMIMKSLKKLKAAGADEWVAFDRELS